MVPYTNVQFYVTSASVSQLRSYLNEKNSGSRSRKQRLMAVGTRCADHVTPLYPQRLELTSPTGGGRSVGIVRVLTKATGGGGMFFEQTYNSNITACKVDDSVARKREILPVSGTHSFVKQWT